MPHFVTTLRRIWFYIRVLAGSLVILNAIFMVIVLALAIIVAGIEGELVEKWPVFYWMAVLCLSICAFLNMLYFFWRLKRSNPNLYYLATGGQSGTIYMVSSDSSYRQLHAWVVKLTKDANSNLRWYATFTRYLNVVCLYGWVSQIFVAFGIVLYVTYIRAT